MVRFLVPADPRSNAAVCQLLNVVLLLLLLFRLLFFGLLLVFLTSLAPLAGGNRLVIVCCIAVLTHVIITIDSRLLFLGDRLCHVGFFEAPTEKWHLGVELAALHVSVVGLTLLAALARTRLLLWADEHFINGLWLKIKNVMEKTVSWNHHLQAAGVEGVRWVHEGAQKRLLVEDLVLLEVLGHLELLFLGQER
jgi:hypothetical protein